MIKTNDIIACLLSPFYLIDWYSQRLRKRDCKVWVFGAWRGDLYEDNSRAMFEWVIQFHPEITAIWLTHSNIVQSRLSLEGKNVAMIDSKEGRKWCRRAAVGFTCWGWKDLNVRCTNGMKQVWLWHGMPLKMIGRDMHSLYPSPTRWKNFKTSLRKVLMPWEFQKIDITITSSNFFTPFLMSAFNIPESAVILSGLPRNDFFFSHDKETLIKKIDARFNNPTKILYMPTFRDEVNRQGCPFNPFANFGFDAVKFRKVLEDNNIVFIYKGHYYDLETGSADIHPLGERFITISGNEYESQYLFIKDCDILMTDYSSIYFDWLFTGKPVILAPFDISRYTTTSRQFYFDYGLMQGDIIHSWEEWCTLMDLRKLTTIDEKTVHRFCGTQNGDSCKKLYNAVIPLLDK